MPPASSGTNVLSDGETRLHGWKEIANYLGRGVRTAQRWEREYGLPVHRIGRDGGEIVFANASELTAWFASHRRGAPPVGDCRERAAPRGWRQAVRVAGIVGVTGMAVFGMTLFRYETPQNPVSITVNNGVLHARNREGRDLWAHRFDGPIRDAFYAESNERLRAMRHMIRDLDGDGLNEVVFGTISDDRHPSYAFHVFNHDGSPRFLVRPTEHARFGATVYDGPWLPYRVFAGRSRGDRTSLYFVFTHGLDFPTVLLEVTADGRERGRYWSNGFIERVEEVTLNGEPTVLIGAANNDLRGASLAIFSNRPLAGSSPAINAEYRCMDCPPGAPSAFVLFPRRCIGEIGNRTGTVADAWTDNQGRINVQVAEGRITAALEFTATAWYTLNPDLTLNRVEITDGLLEEHLRLEREGRLQHPLDSKEDSRLFPVRVWTDTQGWRVVPPVAVTK